MKCQKLNSKDIALAEDAGLMGARHLSSCDRMLLLPASILSSESLAGSELYGSRRIYVLTDQTESTNLTTQKSTPLQFRPLTSTDGMALHRLVSACPPLDTNSSYCNLLQCSHFHDTSIAVLKAGELVGSVSAYRIPERPDKLFVWQVAVHPSMRGMGLARTMLRNLLKRMTPQGVRYIETSITPGNEASIRLFTGLATEQNADLLCSVMFDRELHFDGAHETENLYRIGPLEASSGSRTEN